MGARRVSNREQGYRGPAVEAGMRTLIPGH